MTASLLILAASVIAGLGAFALSTSDRRAGSPSLYVAVLAVCSIPIGAALVLRGMPSVAVMVYFATALGLIWIGLHERQRSSGTSA